MMYQMIAFIIIFSLLLGIYSISLKISRIVQKFVNMTLVLWIPSKILGAVVSFIKGYLILFIIFVFLMIPLGNYSIFKESTFINIILNKTPIVSKHTSSFTKPILEIIDFSKKVNNKKITAKDANKRAISIMINYDVVDKNTVEKLYEKKKL